MNPSLCDYGAHIKLKKNKLTILQDLETASVDRKSALSVQGSW